MCCIKKVLILIYLLACVISPVMNVLVLLVAHTRESSFGHLKYGKMQGRKILKQEIMTKG